MNKFSESQEMWSSWRNQWCNKSVCYYQLQNESVMVEKWAIWKKETGHQIVIVEIYPDGNGFTSYFEPK